MTEAMPFLQKYDITFLRPPTIRPGSFLLRKKAAAVLSMPCLAPEKTNLISGWAAAYG